MKGQTLPKVYMQAKYRFLSTAFNKLPSITVNAVKGTLFYRVNDHGNIHRFYASSHNGRHYEALYRLSRQLNDEMKKLAQEYHQAYGGYIKVDSASLEFTDLTCPKYDDSFWKNADCSGAGYTNENQYIFNGINYRSRAEMMIAQILTDMGLKFKYEVRITANGHDHSVDFAVYLPEFKCCFFIEYLGMLDDDKYASDTGYKLRDYFTEGIYPNKNLILLCGNRNELPSADIVRNSIHSMIESITLMFTYNKITVSDR